MPLTVSSQTNSTNSIKKLSESHAKEGFGVKIRHFLEKHLPFLTSIFEALFGQEQPVSKLSEERVTIIEDNDPGSAANVKKYWDRSPLVVEQEIKDEAYKKSGLKQSKMAPPMITDSAAIPSTKVGRFEAQRQYWEQKNPYNLGNNEDQFKKFERNQAIYNLIRMGTGCNIDTSQLNNELDKLNDADRSLFYKEFGIQNTSLKGLPILHMEPLPESEEV